MINPYSLPHSNQKSSTPRDKRNQKWTIFPFLKGNAFKAAAAGNRAVPLEKIYGDRAQARNKAVYPNEPSPPSPRRKIAGSKSKNSHYGALKVDKTMSIWLISCGSGHRKSSSKEYVREKFVPYVPSVIDEVANGKIDLKKKTLWNPVRGLIWFSSLQKHEETQNSPATGLGCSAWIHSLGPRAYNNEPHDRAVGQTSFETFCVNPKNMHSDKDLSLYRDIQAGKRAWGPHVKIRESGKRHHEPED